MQYSPVIKDQVRALFFEGCDTKDIAKRMRIQLSAVTEWVKEGDWDVLRRDRARAELHERGDVILEQEKSAVVERKVRISQKLDSHIEKQLDKKNVKSRDLVNVAKAAQASTSMTESIMGLKKAASLQVFVQFNLRPKSIEEALRDGSIDAESIETSLPSLPESAGG